MPDADRIALDLIFRGPAEPTLADAQTNGWHDSRYHQLTMPAVLPVRGDLNVIPASYSSSSMATRLAQMV